MPRIPGQARVQLVPNERGGQPGYPWGTAQNIFHSTAIIARNPAMRLREMLRWPDGGHADAMQLAGFFAVLAMTEGCA